MPWDKSSWTGHKQERGQRFYEQNLPACNCQPAHPEDSLLQFISPNQRTKRSNETFAKICFIGLVLFFIVIKTRVQKIFLGVRINER